MQPLALFTNLKLEKPPASQRAELISFFVEEINKERPCYYKDKNGKKKKLGLITPRAVAIKLSILKTTQELREFLSECRDYKHRHKSFSKRFFGGFKEQKW